ncbi:long-chain-fatty-acid--CoA ligase [Trujillonella endophytica]|uniref:Fatty-acyl-CoA synthase n=1 Tax=Trujillonella endophytica TaxID=673521 RepID=A0A1H8QTK7_9ACTN|nr:long-chain-fatty-acid--CoA ligase [Trujillella endophytica]SEO57194.1 fatty-acyl-CoA synthase [Trujillella endophytica]
MAVETFEPAQARPVPQAGLMMDFPLTVHHVLRRMQTIHGASKVVTLVDPETGAVTEREFRDVVARAGRLAHALERLGVRPGDRVASLAWNNAQHLEVYLAVMCMGAVLHTMNLRLHGDQLAYTVEHAGDGVVIVESSLGGQLAEVLPQLPGVRHVVVIAEPGEECPELPDALDLEALLAQESSHFPWPEIDERSAAALCYTSGTTGDPKGVMYSHRSIVLHALAMAGADVYGITSRDRVLALVPLFHAMGWGLPFVCGLVGSDIVMPGRHLKPAPLARLIEAQRTTWSAGVPTLWLDLLHHLDSLPQGETPDLSSLQTILCGGTAVPETLVREYDSRFGAEMIEGWGMTEIFPGATVERADPDDSAVETGARRRSAGRISPLYELRLVGDEGTVLPHDGVAVGNVEVRGPSVASGYYRAPAATAAAVHDGWLRTGDVGTIDGSGHLRITDRAKDVIKSGGEWISSQDLEGELIAHPAVREAAVIGVADPRWGERPLAFVVLAAPVTETELKEFLSSRVARWWVPEHFRIVEQIARTTTGKYDKKILRSLVDDDQG